MVFRIVSWNLDRPSLRHSEQIPSVLKKISEINANIWVLNETDDAIDLWPTHKAIASVLVDGLHGPEENWTTVWYPSNCCARALPTYDAAIAVSAEIELSSGPFFFFGTVLPYQFDPGPFGGEKGWSEHYRVIPKQGADWRSIMATRSHQRLCVGGDLNQSRDGRLWFDKPYQRQWYGTDHGRELLTTELKNSGLTCVTEEDLVAAGKLNTRSTVIHFCLKPDLADQVVAVGAWEASLDGGEPVSDHNGIYIDLAVD